MRHQRILSGCPVTVLLSDSHLLSVLVCELWPRAVVMNPRPSSWLEAALRLFFAVPSVHSVLRLYIIKYNRILPFLYFFHM